MSKLSLFQLRLRSFLAVLLLLSFGSLQLFGQQTLPSDSYEQRLKSLELSLTQALQSVETLKSNLNLRLVAYTELKAAYEKLLQTQQSSQDNLQLLEQTIKELQNNLQISDNSLTTALQQLEQTKKLSQDLKTALEQLSKQFETYKQDSEAVIKKLNRELFWWKVGFTTVTIGGVAALTWALVQAFGGTK
jgi:tetratricopeptide (TPR) repeat protein